MGPYLLFIHFIFYYYQLSTVKVQNYLWIFLWFRYEFWVPNSFSHTGQLYTKVLGKCFASICLFMSLMLDVWLEQMSQEIEPDPFLVANCSKSSCFVMRPKIQKYIYFTVIYVFFNQNLFKHFFLWTRYALLLPSCLLQYGQV